MSNNSEITRDNSSAIPSFVELDLKTCITGTEICWMVLFVVTAGMSICGNVIVIIVFKVRLPRKKCDTSLKPYLINMAVADLIMAVFCMPFTSVDALCAWVFPPELCSIVLFLQVLSVAASVFTNVAIGLNRLRAILCPLRSMYTLKTYSWTLIIIWVASMCIASVQLKVGNAVSNNETVHCREIWPSHTAQRAYTLCIFSLIYAIPLIVLTCTYTSIGISLWRNPRRDELIKSKTKVVKMLVIVVAMFGVCWLPLHLFILLIDFYPGFENLVPNETLTKLFISSHWLAMSNSFANPIIYGFTNESFRADLVTLFYMWFPCCVCLTRMLPRHSSGSTYETVVFRRQSLYKQAAKIGGSYHTRTVRAPRGSKPYLNGHRNRFEYEDIKTIDNNENVANGCGKRVFISCDKEYVRLDRVQKNSVSDCSEPSVGVTESSKPGVTS